MPLINLPDGSQANFPDTMSDDEIAAAIQKANPRWAHKTAGTKAIDTVDAFLDAVGNKIPFMNKVPNTWGGDEENAQKLINQNNVDHPTATTVGNVVGDTLPYVVGGALGAGAKLGLGGITAINSGIGAAQGAANTTVNPKTDNFDHILEYLKNADVGAVGGALGTVGGKYVGDLAEHLAPKVVGASKSIISGLPPGARASVGKYLLNAPEGGEQVIQPFASSEAMLARNKINKNIAGTNIGDILTNADKAGNKFNTTAAIDAVDKLHSDVPNAPINKSNDKAVQDSINNLLEHATSMGDDSGNMSLTDANDLKTQYGKLTNWKPTNVGEFPANDVNSAVYKILKKNIEGGIASGDNGEQALQDYLTNNDVYKSATNANTMLSNLQNQEDGNNIVGLASKIAIASGNPSGVAGGIGTELANRRLGTGVVYGMDKLGKSTLGATPQGANISYSAINDYLNQNTPGHNDQQGSDNNQ